MILRSFFLRVIILLGVYLRIHVNVVIPSRSGPGQREKHQLKVFFTLLCGTSKGFSGLQKIF